MIQRRILYGLWLRRLRKLIRNDQLILSVLAVVVGAAAAFGTILIRLSITYIETMFMDTGGGSIVERGSGFALVANHNGPDVQGLIVGLFIFISFRATVPKALRMLLRRRLARWPRIPCGRVSVQRSLGSASIGAGASVGREGPAVHLGATFGAWIAEKLHLTRSLSRASGMRRGRNRGRLF